MKIKHRTKKKDDYESKVTMQSGLKQLTIIVQYIREALVQTVHVRSGNVKFLIWL